LKYLVGGIAGVVLVVIALLALLGLGSGPELSVQFAAPDSVGVARPFEVRLTASNPHPEAVTLDSIDIDSSVFRAFRIVEVSPPPANVEDVSLLDQRSWAFFQDVAPGSQVSVVFRFEATAPGTHQIPIDVCNAYQDCSRTLLSVAVAAP
jgi:hypothetical protein